MQRADEITQSNWYQVRNDTPGKYFRSRNVNFNQWSASTSIAIGVTSA
jgi:hypothetical protein